MAERLRARATEIAGEILDRLRAMEEESPARDLEYFRGLSNAVSQGVEYAIEVIAAGEDRAPPVPVALITQARLAARQRIPLDLVIRRYLAGQSLLEDHLLDEASRAGVVDPGLLKSAAAAHRSAFERVLASATEEYRREESTRITSPEARRLDQIQRLMASERVDTSSLEYGLDGHHLGLVALSMDARPLLRQLAKETGGRILTVSPSEDEVWAWIGGRDPVDVQAVSRWLDANCPDSIPLGVGELAEALSGWQRTHRQAKAALPFADPDSDAVVQYRDIALIECASRDHLLREFLHDTYLTPLAEEGERGHVLSQTLLAYFQTDLHGSAAAAVLGVSRQTVSSRIRQVEQCLGQPLSKCGEALYTALRLESLEGPVSRT